MKYIQMSAHAQKKKINMKRIFFFSLLLAFLVTTVVLIIERGPVIKDLISFRRMSVVYDTFKISFDKEVSSNYQDMFKQNLGELSYNGKKRFEFVESNGDIVVHNSLKDGSQEVFSDVLIPVGHLYSLVNEVKGSDLKNFSIYVLNDRFVSYLKEQYGIDAVKSNSQQELVSMLKQSDKNMGLVEFKDLSFDMKIMTVDAKYYLDDTQGGISMHLYASLKDTNKKFILDVLKNNVGSGTQEIDSSKLAKVNMTGVVAISRGVAVKMDAFKNYDYPAEVIGDFLADADLTHISNEVSFVEGCTSYSGMRFCARPEYIEVLKRSGVDIVELTGNHNNDYGSSNNTKTIETYKSLGMRYFGGGLNTADASKILYEEVNGTKMAFIGYNYYDTMLGTGAIAGEDHAGGNSYSVAKLEKDILEAKKNASIVIVDFQFQECYSYPDSDVVFPICYKPLSSPDQKGVFRKAVELGANIVIGAQAHQPQTFELYGDGVIFYGLGNLFFDQSMWIGTRQGLVLTHYFYEGKYIQTKVTPIYMDKSLQPKIATKEQGDLLLKLLKDARD